MDYKSKFLNLSDWRKTHYKSKIVCPFDVARPTIYEYIAPDGVTVFIGYSGIPISADDTATTYLAEAPQNCPMRLAMENGGIEMYDYWCSRPWLIKLEFSILDDSHFLAEYISPQTMDPESLHRLRNAPTVSPLDQKLKFLTDMVEMEGKRKPGKLPWLQKDLADFMKVYEAKKAIAKKSLKCA